MVRFQGILATHERELAAAYERSAAAATHSTTRGGQREEALRDFLREHLPKRYAVAQGHAIDSAGTESPQLDIVIYDSMSAAPLSQDAGIVTLAAEALLAVVEVKSTLDGAELEKIARSLRTLYRLRPFGAGWGSPILGGRPSGGLPQLYYSVFAYETAFGRRGSPRVVRRSRPPTSLTRYSCSRGASTSRFRVRRCRRGRATGATLLSGTSDYSTSSCGSPSGDSRLRGRTTSCSTTVSGRGTSLGGCRHRNATSVPH